MAGPRGGWVLRLYEHSLSIALLSLFALAFTGHLVTGARAYSAEQSRTASRACPRSGTSSARSSGSSRSRTGSPEFLAVGCLVVLSVYLRERGSSESKPVAAPHAKTGSG
jgi:hypothetical protein